MRIAGVSTSGRLRPAVAAALAAVVLTAPVRSLAVAASAAAGSTAGAPSSASAAGGTAGTSNLIPTPPDADLTPPDTAEIPPAAAGAPGPDGAAPPTTSGTTQPDAGQGDIARYQQEQAGMPPEQLKSLQEFVSEGSMTTPIGMELREARRKLNSGEEADGLLIIDVTKGSPAAQAGLHGYHRTAHDLLTGAAMAGAMVFPPAILLIPALDYTQIGESYDMIIGVDGSRVTNFLDFQDRMRDVQPGELIYLSVVRDGKRLQVAVPVPPNLTQLAN